MQLTMTRENTLDKEVKMRRSVVKTHRGPRALLLGAIVMAWAFCLGPASALASKQAVAYFGTKVSTGSLGGEFTGPGDIAINSTGAGQGNVGDVYVIDNSYADAGTTQFNSRIQRFSQDDNGTPANPYDDAYNFVSAWGADVDATPSGGSDYEICTVASECKPGVASGGNGTSSGNGSLNLEFDRPGIAVDQDTGLVYVADRLNKRVNVYEGDGAFVRSFGYDVVASGPDDSGTGYEICVAAAGDVCKAGAAGAGVGQIIAFFGGPGGIAISPPDNNPSTGTLFLADSGTHRTDSGNHRINTYKLDGSSPKAIESSVQFETGPFGIAVDSRGIVYAESGDQPSNWKIARYDSEDANGNGVGFLAPIEIPPLITQQGEQVNGGLEVDPDSDGPGPDTDVLYALRGLTAGKTVVQQFGPINSPGLTVPPDAADDAHGEMAELWNGAGLAVDASNGLLFVSSSAKQGAEPPKSGVYVLAEAGGPPTGSLDSVDGITATSATAHITVNPNGPPDVSYQLEYSTDGSTWSKESPVVVGRQETPQAIAATLDPPGTGLVPSTLYHVRLAILKAFNAPVLTPELTFTTLPAPPNVETVGSPVRGATNVTLEGRVNPGGTLTTYHFEYGSAGPCDANPCQSTELVAVGSGTSIRFVSQRVTGLSPSTTYHYRLAADNGVGGSPVFGEDTSFTTQASDQLAPADLPGPVGSDRAWELVSLADSGGNPVPGGMSFSDDGDRATYQFSVCNPSSDAGTFFSMLFAERTSSGWHSTQLAAPRDEVIGPNWLPPAGTDDLSDLFTFNFDPTREEGGLWHLRPGSSPVLLHRVSPGQYEKFYAASDDGSRKVALLIGDIDPAYPAPPSSAQLYDVTNGTPQLISLLPGDTAPSCGVQRNSPDVVALSPTAALRSTRWVSPDGSLLLFPSRGDASACPSSPVNLYLRDLEAGETVNISGSPLSGSPCNADVLKQTPGAVFFITASRLGAEDTTPDNCSVGRDVYRYDIEAGSRECVTCSPDGPPAEVREAAVAPDGSRAYFKSAEQLLPGAVTPAIYRVDAMSGALAYVAPIETEEALGDSVNASGAISPDGSVLIFRSSSAALDAINGSKNGGTAQYYRYDDEDRSLICVSCPQDGSIPSTAVNATLAAQSFTPEVGPNADPLDDSGKTFIFATPNPLVGADQNTAAEGQASARGQDVYEWRDGRILLVSDGLTNWPNVGV